MLDRIAAAACALALALTAVPAAADGLSPARQQELLHLLRHDCGSCHGMTLKGGLGPPLRPKQLAGRSDEDLVTTIMQGVPDTPMPPWGVELERGEVEWLVRQLKSGLGDDAR